MFYIKHEQRRVEQTGKLEESRKQLNLQLNCQGIYGCRERIQGVYLIQLPSSSALREKILMSSHRKTLHG